MRQQQLTYSRLVPNGIRARINNREDGLNRLAQAQHILCCRLLGVVGWTMPSQTVHIPEGLYQYVLRTKEDGQSTSGRVTELMQEGKQREQTHE